MAWSRGSDSTLAIRTGELATYVVIQRLSWSTKCAARRLSCREESLLKRNSAVKAPYTPLGDAVNLPVSISRLNLQPALTTLKHAPSPRRAYFRLKLLAILLAVSSCARARACVCVCDSTPLYSSESIGFRQSQQFRCRNSPFQHSE